MICYCTLSKLIHIKHGELCCVISEMSLLIKCVPLSHNNCRNHQKPAAREGAWVLTFIAVVGIFTDPLRWNIAGGKSDFTATTTSLLSTHSVWGVMGRGWDVSWGWWVRLALVRSRCVGQGQETWTGGCWAIDLCGSVSSSNTSVDACLNIVCAADTNLVLEAGQEPSAGGWRGQCARSFLHSHH